MSLVTPNQIRTLQRKLYAQGQARAGIALDRRLALGACLGVKHIGKPCAGEPLARFDEGGQATVARVRLLRHRQTKGAATDRLGLRAQDACFLLYPKSRWLIDRLA